jgi:hypothetical protein
MYPFLANTKSPNEGGTRRPRQLKELTDDVGYLFQLAKHTAALKFWLSEPAYDALKELSASQNVSTNEWLRGYFAMHCYGTYTITALLKKNSRAFKDIDDGIRFSRMPEETPRGMISQPIYFVPELGKNVAPVKVWLADLQKTDMQILADHAKITLSEYCRETVTARLLGHGTLPMRPEMLACTPSPEALAWAADDEAEIPYRKVKKSEYAKRRFGYQSSEWVPDPKAESKGEANGGK